MAAGNQNDDVQYYSPQRKFIRNAWVVGNMTSSDKAYSGSNYGNNVHAWGPGTAIWSCGIGGTEFAQMTGTSMASPYVAGVLLVRGDGKIITDGTVSKGGYSASIAVVKK